MQTLRTDAEASESLGAAISGIARHLGESAGFPIRATVDEQTRRLRPEVESERFEAVGAKGRGAPAGSPQPRVGGAHPAARAAFIESSRARPACRSIQRSAAHQLGGRPRRSTMALSASMIGVARWA